MKCHYSYLMWELWLSIGFKASCTLFPFGCHTPWLHWGSRLPEMAGMFNVQVIVDSSSPSSWHGARRHWKPLIPAKLVCVQQLCALFPAVDRSSRQCIQYGFCPARFPIGNPPSWISPVKETSQILSLGGWCFRVSRTLTLWHKCRINPWLEELYEQIRWD